MSEADAFTVAMRDLRKALERVLDAAEEELGSVVDLAADYYWIVPPEDTFEAVEMPRALHAGQLSDDVSELHDLLTREDGEVFVWHDLQHLVGILQRIAILATPPSGPQV